MKESTSKQQHLRSWRKKKSTTIKRLEPQDTAMNIY